MLFCRCVVLIPEESEDMWHAYNLISVGDVLKSTTIRLVCRQFVHKSLISAVQTLFFCALCILSTDAFMFYNIIHYGKVIFVRLFYFSIC